MINTFCLFLFQEDTTALEQEYDHQRHLRKKDISDNVFLVFAKYFTKDSDEQLLDVRFDNRFLFLKRK